MRQGHYMLGQDLMSVCQSGRLWVRRGGGVWDRLLYPVSQRRAMSRLVGDKYGLISFESYRIGDLSSKEKKQNQHQ